MKRIDKRSTNQSNCESSSQSKPFKKPIQISINLVDNSINNYKINHYQVINKVSESVEKPLSFVNYQKQPTRKKLIFKNDPATYRTNNEKSQNFNIDLIKKDSNEKNRSGVTISPGRQAASKVSGKNNSFKIADKNLKKRVVSNINESFSNQSQISVTKKESFPKRKGDLSPFHLITNRQTDSIANTSTSELNLNLILKNLERKKNNLKTNDGDISSYCKLIKKSITKEPSSPIIKKIQPSKSVTPKKQNFTINIQISNKINDFNINKVSTTTSKQSKMINENKISKEELLSNENLTQLEKDEISKLNDVYYIGNRLNLKSVKNFEGNTDDQGNFKIQTNDHINYRYQMISELGRGSFGQAFKCFDHKEKREICLKVIKSKKQFINQAKTEIKILSQIKEMDKKNYSNTVIMYDYFVYRNHIFMAFELLDMNLYEYLKMKEFKGLSLNYIKAISIQLLYTLIFLKKNEIIHCDLKPENILLDKNKKNGIKVIDFGSSCFENERIYTYIQSRFYRSPEVLLGCEYGIEIDMWSFGCIIAELYRGIPIFPGENEIDQMNVIMQYLGIPDSNMISQAKKKSNYFDENCKPFLSANSKGKIRKVNSKTIDGFLAGADVRFIDFVKCCLVYNVKKRIKPEDALEHIWISGNNTIDINSQTMSLNKNHGIKDIDLSSNTIKKLTFYKTNDKPASKIKFNGMNTFK